MPPKSKPQSAQSHESKAASKQLPLELEQLNSLMAEFQMLESNISELEARLQQAPPQVVQQEADPLNQVFKSFESLIPLVGPLLALL